MIYFPHSKINLGLRVKRRRSDGYHDLDTVFYPLHLNDALELIAEPGNAKATIHTTGINIDGDASENICMKAYRLLLTDYPNLPGAQFYLHKAIPTGAGLGGGSSDGATALRLLSDSFKLEISKERLLTYALQLGSDCAFFLHDAACHAEGRGEVLSPVAIDLSMYSIAIVYPGIHVSTRDAFEKITPNDAGIPVMEIITRPVEEWKSHLRNDFEESVFDRYPAIASVKKAIYDSGAIYASMTGSGSAVYGLFRDRFTPKLAFPENYFVRLLNTEG